MSDGQDTKATQEFPTIHNVEPFEDLQLELDAVHTKATRTSNVLHLVGGLVEHLEECISRSEDGLGPSCSDSQCAFDLQEVTVP